MAKKLAPSINWIWRSIATAFGFVLFGVFGLLFKIILLPYVLVANKENLVKQLQARRLVSNIWRCFRFYVCTTGVVSVHYHGFERLGREGQLILANHPSLLDVVFILAQIPHINCIVKKDLLNNPVMNSPILACGFLLNDQSVQLVEKAAQILEKQSLLIFPEGTRTGWDGKIVFNRGAVAIGLRSAKVITPVVVRVNPPNFKKNQPWYQIPKRKVEYHFCVGEDIDPQTYLNEKPLPIAARLLNQQLQDYFQQETSL